MPNAIWAALLLLALAFSDSHAATSANIPVGSRVYDDLERLEVKGLIESGLLSSKPFSRLEGLRLLKEAERNAELGRRARARSGADDILRRLRRDFRDEESEAPGFIKPVDEAYARVVYGDGDPLYLNVNNRGDELAKGLNLRSGFSLNAAFNDTVTMYLNPEYRADAGGAGAELVHGYLGANLGNMEVLIGRDSLWWGSGYHGGLLVTDNAKPFDMVKVSSAHPFLLPWIFGYLGPFRPTVFLTRLESVRDFPNANLLGMRLDFRPLRGFQIGFNRVFMFGGEGRRALTASEWLKVFIASDSTEHAGSPANGNQIASIDASLVYVNGHEYLPFSGIKLYTEWGAEDSSGDTKTPTGRANIYGAFIDGPFWLRDAELRVEWANTARSARYGPNWYRHEVYTSGYTYEGRIIGHHMGPDSRDLFARAEYHVSGGLTIGVEYDRERSAVHTQQRSIKKDWYGADLNYRIREGLTVQALIGIDKYENPARAERISSPGASAGIEWIF